MDLLRLAKSKFCGILIASERTTYVLKKPAVCRSAKIHQFCDTEASHVRQKVDLDGYEVNSQAWLNRLNFVGQECQFIKSNPLANSWEDLVPYNQVNIAVPREMSPVWSSWYIYGKMANGNPAPIREENYCYQREEN